MSSKNWNSNAIKILGQDATAFDGGWINYKKANGDWSPIDCILVKDGTGFHVVNAPFEFHAPLLSGGEATFNVNNRYDVFTKTDITANPFSQKMKAFGVGSVEGILYDINGDGRLDAVRYPNAYGAGVHLVYYVQHGREPRLKELVQFDQELLADTDYEFELTYSGRVEISTSKIPNGRTRRQHRDATEIELDTPSRVSHDNGFYIRAYEEPQKRGIGIKTPIIWDSASKSEVIDVDIRKGQGANTYILTKHIKASFFNDVVYPVFTDTTSTFFPNPNTGTPGIDGVLLSFSRNEIWVDIVNSPGSGINAVNASFTAIRVQARNILDKWQRLYRGLYGFDTSIIGSDIISLAILSIKANAKNNSLGASPLLNITSVSPASNTNLINSDFSTYGDIVFSEDLAYADVNIAGVYNDFPLNASGIDYIDRDGISNFGLRDNAYDIPVISPPWSNSLEFSITTIFSETAGPDDRPKLVVVHAPPPVPGEPTPLFERMFDHLLPKSEAFKR